MLKLATTVGPPALTELGRVAVLAALIFAALRWRGVATVAAVAASLVFARGVLFFTSELLHHLAWQGQWSAIGLLCLSNMVPAGLTVWLLWSHAQASAWMLALFEIGVLAIGGVLMVSAVSKDARIGVPLIEIATASVPVRVAILAAIVVMWRQAGPSSAWPER